LKIANHDVSFFHEFAKKSSQEISDIRIYKPLEVIEIRDNFLLPWGIF